MARGDVRLWHTANGIIMGVENSREFLDQRAGWRVMNPVIVVVSGEGANLMAIYTLTEENEYFIPADTLIYGESMTPSERLQAAYRAKYMPSNEPPAMGLELTTSPAAK